MPCKLALLLACLLLSGLSGCTGDESGDGTAVDPCGLFTAKELSSVLAAGRPGTEGRLVATRRYVTLDGSVPTDVCGFDQVHSSAAAVERALEIRVTANRQDLSSLSNADQSHPIEDLGDEAYFSGGSSSSLVVRRDDLLVLLTLEAVDGHSVTEAPGPLVSAFRQALDRLPDHATIAGLIARGPCARVDRSALAAALGGRVGHSRSLSSGAGDTCSFTAANDRRAELTLVERPDGRQATAIQRAAPRLDLPGVDAYWHTGEAVVYANGRALSIQAPAGMPVPEARLTPGLVELAGAAARAYGLRDATPSPRPAAGSTDPCALLTPEEVGRLDFSVRDEPVPLSVVTRAVWSYGDNVPVDTCGYERFRTVAGERPDVEVAIAAGHYDPVAEDDRFPKEPESLDGLGDRAYFVSDSDETWLVVERGPVQLTLHGRLSYQDDRTTVRTRYLRAAQAALTRLPEQASIAASVTDPACSKAGAAIAGAVGGKLRYTRGVSSGFAATCTYTMASGSVVQVGVERDLTAADLRKEREHATRFDAPDVDAGYSGLWSSQGDLIKVFGTGAMLTISAHDPGKRAFPTDLGPGDIELARAAEPLLH
ncbi:hypothetical protein [Flindersiella endophytica]